MTEKIELIKITILEDGYMCRQRNLKFPLIENTNAFDTALYLVFCRMVDDEKFKGKVMELASEDMKILIRTYLEKGAHIATYNARNEVLMKLFEEEVVNGMRILNCESTMLNVLEKMYTVILPSATIRKKCQCRTNKHEEVPILTAYFDDDGSYECLSSLQVPICRKCDQVVVVTASLNALVFVNMRNNDLRYGKIKQIIRNQEDIRILCAIVETIVKNDKTYHVAHIKRSNQVWYTFDTILRKISVAKFSDQATSVHMLCYFSSSPSQAAKERNQRKNSQPFGIIQNFHTYTLKGTKVNIVNACAPDAVFHVLCSIYSDNRELFKAMYEEPRNRLLSLVKAFDDGNEDETYYERVMLFLEKKFEISIVNFSEITINCESNIFNSVQLRLDSFPSAVISHECGCAADRRLAIIEINIEKLIANGVQTLSSCFLFQNAEHLTCSVCKNKMKVHTTFSDMIFIDIQPIITDTNTATLPRMPLTDLPHHFEINAIQYELKGVIEYQPNEGGLAHYVAHCRSKHEWFLYNDLMKKRYPSNTNASIESHVLIFTRLSD